jgi:carbohydrate diacid regulator
MLIRFSVKMNVYSLDIIQALFPEQQKDFVFTVNDTDLVIVKEVKPNVEPEHIEMLAKALIDVIDHEEHARACVGIGSVVSDITELNRSFKESQIAIEVGKIFEREKS